MLFDKGILSKESTKWVIAIQEDLKSKQHIEIWYKWFSKRI